MERQRKREDRATKREEGRETIELSKKIHLNLLLQETLFSPPPHTHTHSQLRESYYPYPSRSKIIVDLVSPVGNDL